MFRNLSSIHSLKANKHKNAKWKNRWLRLESLEHRRVFAGLLLNEIVSDPSGTDTGFEYVEIKGIPGQTVSNVYFISIEGDSASQGLADRVINLSGSQIGSNGLLIITPDPFGHSIPAETTRIINEGFSLENGSNSFALIESPTAILETTDLDPNNDGVLDLPSGASLIDAIGWLDGGSADFAYGVILTQALSLPPGAATRFRHDNRALNFNAWYNGDLTGANSSLAYSTTTSNLSSNFPVGGALTPGATNVPGDANLAPNAVADEYQLEPGGTLNINAGSGVLSNDSDPNGANSILWGVLDSAAPGNASSFTFNEDGSFSYVNNGTAGTVTFNYKATDLNLFSTSTLVTINVVASTNNPPSITVPSGPSTYTEGNLPELIAATATLSDSDSANFASGSLTVAIVENAEAADLLSVRNQGNNAGEIGVAGSTVSFGGVVIGSVSGGIGSAPLVVDLNSNSTPESVQALMRNVGFSNSSENPTTANRRIRFQANDGDGGPSGGLSNEAFTTVTVVAVNDAPTFSPTRQSVFYAAGAGATTLDGLIGLTDPDSIDFDSGVLTAVLSQGLAGDVLTIRSAGTGAGQVSVSGTSVSYGGTVVGTLVEGSNTAPMTVTFNSSATSEAARAVARSIVFNTTSPLLRPEVRTVNVALNDGDGGTSLPASYTIIQSLTRRFAFQEGVDHGQGFYTGAGDIQLAENQPNTPLPVGANPVTEGLLVDWSPDPANSQVLMRFDNLFGTAPNQIPLGANIVAARLVLHTKNGGDGATLHRMLTDWNPETETWNTFGNGVAPRNNTPAVQADGAEARTAWDSQIGVAAANSDPAANPTIIGVTTDLQAWSSGASNFGWVFRGWDTRQDGWAFAASENSDLTIRPRLEVEWIPAAFPNRSLREGVNGYTGVVDTSLTEASPDASNGANATVLVDFRSTATADSSHVLIQFQNLIGNGANQIPAGSLVHSATLDLASTTSNAQGDGGTFHRMVQPWDNLVTWNSLVNGISPDDVEASSAFNATAGNPTLNPNAEAGFNSFDVTEDVEEWVIGSAANHGWAILPWNLGSDGWIVQTSESTEEFRPRLRVQYTPVGVETTPLTILETTESGGTAQVSVKLATPPKAEVTIPVSSSDTTEGTVSVASLVFTPSNWEVPQVITITGVNDAENDGDVSYSLVLGAITSSDLNYQGVDPADVTLINKDQTPTNQPPAVTANNAAVSGPEGSTVTNTGTWSDPNTADVVTLSATVGTVIKNGDGTWSWSIVGTDDTPSTNVTITANDGNGGTASVAFAYSVTNANPVVTVSQANVSGNVLTTLANTGSWSDVATDTVTLAASLGTVAKNGDGTWSWSFIPSQAFTNQTVTITATDDDGGSSQAQFSIDALVAVVNSKVYYKGSTFAGTSVDAALDTSKVIAKSGATTQALTFANLINTTRGINGLVFDVAGLAAASLTASDFVFRMSPTGNFTEASNPPNSWAAAPAPTLIDVTAGNATTPARVRLEWTDNAIENRWLQIKVLANANTGLVTPQVYYIGHLRGETTGLIEAGAFRVRSTDVSPIVSAIGALNVPVTNVLDILKDGRIRSTDSAPATAAVGAALTRITIPVSGSPEEGEGGSGRFVAGAPALESAKINAVDQRPLVSNASRILPRSTDEIFDVPLPAAMIREISSLSRDSVAASATGSPQGDSGLGSQLSLEDYFENLGRRAGRRLR